MKRTRSVGMTYFEMLDWYFKRQQHTPLSLGAQAVMTHILNICNQNYSAEFKMTLKILSANINADVRTLRAKLVELAENGYIEYAQVKGESYNFIVNPEQNCNKDVAEVPQNCNDDTENDAEVCKDVTKMSQTCTKRSVVTPLFEYKRKEKKRKESKRKVEIFNSDIRCRSEDNEGQLPVGHFEEEFSLYQ